MSKTDEKKETGLVLFEGTEKLISSAKRELTANTVGTQVKLNAMVKQYEGLTIAGIDDMASYKVVEQAAKDLKKIRTSIEKYRKEMTAPALKWQKDLKAHADAIIDKLQPVEKALLEKKTKIDDAKKAMEQKLFTDRCKLLAENGYQLTGQYYICGALQVDTEMIVKLTEDEFTFYVNEGEKELKRVEAEKQRKKEEDEALAKRLEELDRREAELKAREAKLNEKENEVEAQTTALEENYEKIEKPIEETHVADETESAPQAVEPQKDAFGDDLPNTPIQNAIEEVVEETMKDVDENFIQAYRAGFEDMKSRIVTLLNGPEKFKRPDLINWIESQKHDGDEAK